MIKFIASDMDGTLLNEHGNLNEEFFSLFHKLKEKGIIFAAASGRQYYNLLKKFEPIKDQMMFIAENGTFVVYKNKELYLNTIEKSVVNELIELGRTLEDAYVVVCGKNSAYIENSDERLISEVKKYYERNEIVKDLTLVVDEVLKVTICDFKGSSLNSNTVFAPIYADKLQVAVSGEIWLDITNKDASKGVAIKKLQEKLGISHEETMVFGDYFNDVEMLKVAYHSYAMENAPDGVKEHARFIAKSNKENGVIDTINKNVLKEIC